MNDLPETLLSALTQAMEPDFERVHAQLLALIMELSYKDLMCLDWVVYNRLCIHDRDPAYMPSKGCPRHVEKIYNMCKVTGETWKIWHFIRDHAKVMDATEEAAFLDVYGGLLAQIGAMSMEQLEVLRQFMYDCMPYTGVDDPVLDGCRSCKYESRLYLFVSCAYNRLESHIPDDLREQIWALPLGVLRVLDENDRYSNAYYLVPEGIRELCEGHPSPYAVETFVREVVDEKEMQNKREKRRRQRDRKQEKKALDTAATANHVAQ